MTTRKRSQTVVTDPLTLLPEAEFQEALIEWAHQHGWLVMHPRPSQRRDGAWQTALHGDPGFPDLVLARAGVTYLWELKSQQGRFQPGQEAWLAASGGSVYRPTDLPKLREILK